MEKWIYDYDECLEALRKPATATEGVQDVIADTLPQAETFSSSQDGDQDYRDVSAGKLLWSTVQHGLTHCIRK